MKYGPALKALVLRFAAGWLPPVRVPLSQWADDHARLSSEASAQVGGWHSFPYQREPLDALSPHSAYESVVLMWAAQMGKTQLLLNLVSYMVAEDPGPCLCVQPTLPMAEAFSKDRLSPLFRDTPALQGLVAAAKSRDIGSTIFHRRFRDGHISIVGANSPAGLASRPIRYLLMDELDRWEDSAGAEGDGASLAIARTRTFVGTRKIVMTSSPTVKDASRIEAAFLESDQRFYHVPCAHCGAFQVLKWKRIEWPEGRPEEAQYRCVKCEKLIPHHLKGGMVARGKWIASNPSSRIAGFHLSELYSPWRAWGELAADWTKAQGNIERMRAFINTSLAELWNDQAQGSVTEDELMARREVLGSQVPSEAAVLTCGVDVQDDRLEASVFAWGRGEASWLLAHRKFPGDPSGPALWAALDEFLLHPFQHPTIGPMPIHAVCVDSGGHFTNAVCQFAEARRGRRVFAIKGMAGPRPIWPKKQSKAAKGRVYIIGVDSAKQVISQRLHVTEGAGCVHFPAAPWCNLEYFRQFTSEFLKTEYRRGRPERVWIRKPGRLAEAWDCAVYAYTALCALVSHGVLVDAEVDRLDLMRRADKPDQAAPAYQVYRSKFVSGGIGR
jgi:phage terminase large subunit GpA-like protein